MLLKVFIHLIILLCRNNNLRISGNTINNNNYEKLDINQSLTIQLSNHSIETFHCKWNYNFILSSYNKNGTNTILFIEQNTIEKLSVQITLNGSKNFCITITEITERRKLQFKIFYFNIFRPKIWDIMSINITIELKVFLKIKINEVLEIFYFPIKSNSIQFVTIGNIKTNENYLSKTFFQNKRGFCIAINASYNASEGYNHKCESLYRCSKIETKQSNLLVKEKRDHINEVASKRIICLNENRNGTRYHKCSNITQVKDESICYCYNNCFNKHNRINLVCNCYKECIKENYFSFPNFTVSCENKNDIECDMPLEKSSISSNLIKIIITFIIIIIITVPSVIIFTQLRKIRKYTGSYKPSNMEREKGAEIYEMDNIFKIPQPERLI